MPNGRPTRRVRIVLVLDEDTHMPWANGPNRQGVTSVEQWLRENLDFERDVVSIESIEFPDGEYDDLVDC